MNQKVQQMNSIIYMACDLLSIPSPYIYYLNTQTNFILLDENYQIISYDIRDVGCNITSIKYNMKENTIYINEKMFEDVLGLYIRILRQLRMAYQIKQVQQMNPANSYNIVSQWAYFYESQKQRKMKYYESAATEVDKNAFAYVILRDAFGIIIRFEKSNEHLQNRIEELSREYSPVDILQAANKFGVSCWGLGRFNLKDF